jgi:hypothetical protein
MNTSKTDTYKLIHKDGIALAFLGIGGITQTLHNIEESTDLEHIVDFVIENDIDISGVFNDFDFDAFDFTIDLDAQIEAIDNEQQKNVYEKLKEKTLEVDLPEIQLLNLYIEKVKL